MEKFTLFQYNNKDTAAHFLFPVLLLLCTLLCSCSTISGTVRYLSDSTGEYMNVRGGRSEFDFDNGLRIYKDANIYTGEIVTRVHPTANLEEKPSALFVPLGLVQNNRDHEAISRGVSRLVYESFLQEQTFSALEYSDYIVPYHVEEMLPAAREKGADYLIGGLINQYYDGGETGESRFAMQLFVYQVDSGDLMWSLHHSGVLPYKPVADEGFFKIKNRMPVNPMTTLISAVGGELATLLHYWTDQEHMKEQERQQYKDSYSGYTDPDAF